jgi:plastocyanin
MGQDRWILLAALTVTVLLAGCVHAGGNASPDAQRSNGDGGGTAVQVVSGESPDRTIDLTNNAFSETSLQVDPGTVIRFKNMEGVHTVTLDGQGIDRELSGSDSVTLQFNEGGTYNIYCTYHGSPGNGMHTDVDVGGS